MDKVRRSLLIASAAVGAAAVIPNTADAAPDFPIAMEPIETLFSRIADWHCDQMLDSKADLLIVDREGFKQLHKSNLIDFIPALENKHPWPTCLGHSVIVPGTAFSLDKLLALA